jgi:hypothetical protein
MSNLVDHLGNPLIVAEPTAPPEDPKTSGPHAQYPLPTWKQVKLDVPAGTTVALVSDIDGVIELAIRPKGELHFPVELTPAARARAIKVPIGSNQINYQTKAKSPPVEHQFVPDKDDPEKCFLCSIDPEMRWVLIVQKVDLSQSHITFPEKNREQAVLARLLALEDPTVETVVLRLAACRVTPEAKANES